MAYREGEVVTVTPATGCGPGCQSCRGLRDAVTDLAYERGFEQVRAAEVIARAGATPEAFATHAGSLEECLLAAYQQAGTELVACFASAFARPGDWHDRMAGATEAVLRQLAAHPAVAHLCYVEAARAGTRIRASRDEQMQRAIEVMIAEHGDDGLPALRFELIAGAVDRAIAARVSAGRLDELPALVDRIVEITAVFEPVAA